MSSKEFIKDLFRQVRDAGLEESLPHEVLVKCAKYLAAVKMEYDIALALAEHLQENGKISSDVDLDVRAARENQATT